MKKVVRKLNRVLSVLLTAAMVAGSAPQTSLVVRAEESGAEATEEITLQSEESSAAESPDGESAVAETASDGGSTAAELSDEENTATEAASSEAASTEVTTPTEATTSADADTETDKESETTPAETEEAVSSEESEDNTAGEEDETDTEEAAGEDGKILNAANTITEGIEILVVPTGDDVDAEIITDKTVIVSLEGISFTTKDEDDNDSKATLTFKISETLGGKFGKYYAVDAESKVKVHIKDVSDAVEATYTEDEEKYTITSEDLSDVTTAEGVNEKIEKIEVPVTRNANTHYVSAIAGSDEGSVEVTKIKFATVEKDAGVPASFTEESVFVTAEKDVYVQVDETITATEEIDLTFTGGSATAEPVGDTGKIFKITGVTADTTVSAVKQAKKIYVNIPDVPGLDVVYLTSDGETETPNQIVDQRIEITDGLKNIKFKVTPRAPYDLDTVKVGTTTKTATKSQDGTYYTFETGEVTETTTVTLTAKYVGHKVTVNVGDNNADVSHCDLDVRNATKDTADSNVKNVWRTQATSTEDDTSKTVYIKVTGKEGYDVASVTYGENSLDAGEVKGGTYSGWYKIEEITTETTVTITLAERKTVTLTKGNDYPTGATPTAKFIEKPEGDALANLKEEDFAALTTTTKLKASGTYLFIFDAGTNAYVDNVAATDGTLSKMLQAKPAALEAYDVYELESIAGNVVITITAAAAGKTVTITQNNNVKHIKYELVAKTGGTIPTTAEELTNLVPNGKNILLKDADFKEGVTVTHDLYVMAVYDDDYEQDKVSVNGQEQTGSAIKADGIYKIDLSVATTSFAVTPKHKRASITFNAVVYDSDVTTEADKTVKIEVDKAEGMTTAGNNGDVDVTDADLTITNANKTFKADTKQTIRFRVKEIKDGYKISSVIDGNPNTIKTYTEGDDTYYEVEMSAVSDGVKTVSVTIAKEDKLNINFEADFGSEVTSIKYKADGATTATELSSWGTAVQVDYNGKFVFSIEGLQKPYNSVDTVSYKVGNGKDNVLVASGGEYTIDNIKRDITIKVTTKFDEKKVNKLTLAFDPAAVTVAVASSVTEVTVANGDGTAGSVLNGAVAEAGVYYVAPAAAAADNKITLIVTPMAGLEADVTGDATEIDANVKKNVAKSYTIDFGKTTQNNVDVSAVGVSKSATITTKSDDTRITSDRYVTFTYNPAEIELDMADATLVKKVGNAVTYQISRETKEAEFTASVPKNKKLSYTSTSSDSEFGRKVFKDGDAVKAGDKNVYTFKILVSQITGSTKDAGYGITLTAAPVDDVNFKLTGDGVGNAGNRSVKAYTTNSNELMGSYDVGGMAITPGTRITVQLNWDWGDYKIVPVDTDNNEGAAVTLDDYRRYSFIIESDTHLKVVGPESNDEYNLTAELYKKTVGDESSDITTEVITRNLLKNDTVQIYAVVNGLYNPDLNVRSARSAGEPIEIKKAEFSKETTDPKSKLALGKAYIDGVEKTDKTAAFLTVSAEDAGKTLIVDLYADVEADGRTIKDKYIGSIGFDVEPAASSATVTDLTTGKTVRSKETVKKDAMTDTIFDVRVSPETDKTYYDVEVESGKANVKWLALQDTTYASYYTDVKERLLVTTADKAEKAVINIVNTLDDSVIYTFTVETVVPALKVSKIESSVQGANDISLTMTADKNVKAPADGKGLYYEVAVTPQSGTAPTGSGKKYYYIEKRDGEISASALLPVNTETAAGKNTKWKYDFEVRLVLTGSKLSINDELGYYASTSAQANVLAGKPVKKTFETKSTANYYEDKLSVTKKTTTVYTGQADVTVAVVKFSKNASKIDNVRINRVLDAKGVDYSSYFSIVQESSYIDGSGYEVRLTVNTSTPRQKYFVEISADAKTETAGDDGVTETMYRATATIPVTVVGGIQEIVVNEKAKVVKAAKDTVYTIKPVGYQYYSSAANFEKAKTQKFEYEIYNVSSDRNYDKVSVKNGKVTIKNGFVIGQNPADNKITIRVKANDFAGHGDTKYEDVELEVVNDQITVSDVYLTNANKTLKGTTFDKTEINGATLHVIDDKGNDVSKYVTITPAYKKNTNYIDGDNTVIVSKAGKMTIKVVARDGSKRPSQMTKTVMINYDEFEQLNCKIEGDAKNHVVQTGTNDWRFKASTTPELSLSILDGKNPAYQSDYNYTVKVVSGGVQTGLYGSNNTVSGIKFVPTAEVTKLQVKEGKKGARPVQITVTNDTYSKTKAPKAVTKDKLYKGLFELSAQNVTDAEGSVTGTRNAPVQTLNYTVDSDKYEAVNVKALGVDHYEFDGTKPITDKKFKLETYETIYDYKYTDSVKYVFVFGKYAEDETTFIPETAPLNVTIKALKTAAYKPVTNYKMNTKDSTVIRLAGKPDNVPVQYSKLQNANYKGQPNDFRKLFKLTNNTLELLETNEAKAIMAKALDPKNKERTKDLSGYVTYKYKDATGYMIEKTTKITVSFDEAQLKYTADPVTVLKGTTNTVVTTTIRLNKNNVALKAVTASSGWTATATDAQKAAGEVTLTAAAADIGKNEVELKFITSDSINKNANITSLADDVVGKAKVTINVLDPAKTKNKTAVNKTIDLTRDVDRASGVYTKAVVKPLRILVSGTVVDKIELNKEAKNVPACISEITYNKANETATIKVNAKDISAGAKINVPVIVTFDTKDTQELVFQMITPAEIPDVDWAKSKIEGYLSSYKVVNGGSGLQSYLAELIADATALFNVTVTATVTEVSPATTPKTYTVDVVLSNPSGATAEEKTITIPTKTIEEDTSSSATVQKTMADVRRDVDAVANSTYIVTTEPAEGNALKGKVLVVSAQTEKFDIRDFLQQQIKIGGYLAVITEFEVEEPVADVAEVRDEAGVVTDAIPGKDGSIKFKYNVIGQGVSGSESAEVTITLPKPVPASSNSTAVDTGL